MLIFGGRAGRYLNDTWVLDIYANRWIEVGSHFTNTTGVAPPPRAFGASVLVPSRGEVVLYGGTNGSENFGDIWIFKWGQQAFASNGDEDRPDQYRDEADHGQASGSLGPTSLEMLWTRGVVVGGAASPSPRYGHQIVVIPFLDHGRGDSRSNLLGGEFVVVLGGCSVSPLSELEGKQNNLGGGGMDKTETKRILKLSQSLQVQCIGTIVCVCC